LPKHSKIKKEALRLMELFNHGKAYGQTFPSLTEGKEREGLAHA
jgi:hypothetical protein